MAGVMQDTLPMTGLVAIHIKNTSLNLRLLIFFGRLVFKPKMYSICPRGFIG